MTTQEAQVVFVLAKNGLKIEPSAKQLYMHRSTLHRYIRKIKKKTGLNPLDFYDMEWLIAKAKTILGLYGTFVFNGGVTK